jgi:hypothetical protein
MLRHVRDKQLVIQSGLGLILVAAGWKLLNRADDKPPAPRLTAPTPSALSRLAFTH